jgi:hypothetical protein
LTINEEYNRFDILSCIKNAIIPREKMIFTIPGLYYPPNGGYPSMAINNMKWAIFDEIELDNALAHHAKDTVTQITGYLNVAMNYGPVATPERRGIIERFFQNLETRGFHRIVSTTGTGIADPRRKGSESDAVKYEISFKHIVELTEVLIANYNTSPHTSLNNFSPLEILKQRVERGIIPTILEEDKQENFALLSYSITRKVNGNKETGRRPYIQIEGGEYRSDELSRNFNLVGKIIVVKVNPDDLRTVTAFLNDGSELGTLYVRGKWAYTPHTLKQRKEVNTFLQHNKIQLGPLDDPIQLYHKYLLSEVKKKKSSRNKLGSLEMSIASKEVHNVSNNISEFTHEKQVTKCNSKVLLSPNELEAIFDSEIIRSLYE